MSQNNPFLRAPLNAALAATILAFGACSAWVVLNEPSASHLLAPAPVIPATVQVGAPAALLPTVVATIETSASPQGLLRAIDAAKEAQAVAEQEEKAREQERSREAEKEALEAKEIATKALALTRSREAAKEAQATRERAAKAQELTRAREAARDEQVAREQRINKERFAAAALKVQVPPAVKLAAGVFPPIPVASPPVVDYSPTVKAVTAPPLISVPQIPLVLMANGAKAWVKINAKQTVIINKGEQLFGYGAYHGLDGTSAKFDNKSFPISNPSN
jgi:hypothetical protein